MKGICVEKEQLSSLLFVICQKVLKVNKLIEIVPVSQTSYITEAMLILA